MSGKNIFHLEQQTMGNLQQSSNATEFIIIKILEKNCIFLCLSFFTVPFV